MRKDLFIDMNIPKKLILLILLIFVILILGIMVILIENNQSPYDYLKENSADSLFAPSEFLFQETSNDGINVVFYINQNGKYQCAILKDAFIGYRIIKYSGSLTIDNADTYLYSSVIYKQKKYEICWGILTDDSVTKVFLDDKPCSVGDTTYSDIRVFWMLGSWDDLPLLTTSS